MTPVDKTLDYCYAHTTAPNAALTAVERATHLRTLSPQMLSGPYQGTLIRLITHMIQPMQALEIGTFTGYTAICMAQGMPDGAVLHTVEVNDELAWLIRAHVLEAGVEEKVRLHIGDAAQVIPTIEGLFDLVFLDAGKLDYARHYELALAKTRPGGFLLADNVLWDGKVAGGDEKDETARILRNFNDFVQQDARVENVLLPIRDGIMLIRKI